MISQNLPDDFQNDVQYQRLMQAVKYARQNANERRDLDKITGEDFSVIMSRLDAIASHLNGRFKLHYDRLAGGDTSPDLHDDLSVSDIVANQSFTELFEMMDDMEKEKLKADRKKLIPFLLIGVIAIVVIGFFVPGVRVFANILIILSILAFSVMQLGALFGSSFQSANPDVPDYAITLGEEMAKNKRESGMGCRVVFGVLGVIVLTIGLFVGWSQNWWYELIGLAVLILIMIIGR